MPWGFRFISLCVFFFKPLQNQVSMLCSYFLSCSVDKQALILVTIVPGLKFFRGKKLSVAPCYRLSWSRERRRIEVINAGHPFVLKRRSHLNSDRPERKPISEGFGANNSGRLKREITESVRIVLNFWLTYYWPLSVTKLIFSHFHPSHLHSTCTHKLYALLLIKGLKSRLNHNGIWLKT